MSGFSLPRILMLTSPDRQPNRAHVIHEYVTSFVSQMPFVVRVAEMGFGDI